MQQLARFYRYFFYCMVCLLGATTALAGDTIYLAKSQWNGIQLQLTYKVQSANEIVGSELKLHNQFTIINGPDWNQTRTTIDGQKFIQAQIQYTVEPLFAGSLKLPQLQVNHTHGMLVSTMQLQSYKNAKLPLLPQLPGVAACGTLPCLQKLLYIQTVFKPKTYYTGEQIPVTYWLHTQVACTQVNTRLLGAADVSLQTATTDTAEQYYQQNGTVWKKILLASYCVMPNAKGNFTLPTLEAVFSIQTTAGKQNVPVQSNAPVALIKPLPSLPTTDTLQYAIGEFYAAAKPQASLQQNIGQYSVSLQTTAQFTVENIRIPIVPGIQWQKDKFSFEAGKLVLPFLVETKPVPDSLPGIRLHYFNTVNSTYSELQLPAAKIIIQQDVAVQTSLVTSTNKPFQFILLLLVLTAVIVVIGIVTQKGKKVKPTTTPAPIQRQAYTPTAPTPLPALELPAAVQTDAYARDVWQQVRRVTKNKPPHITEQDWEQWQQLVTQINTMRFAPPSTEIPTIDWWLQLASLYKQINQQ
ncbi:MAG: hypothetical protein EAZ47_09320 [Bacteroidetes bacterium]|nr:MAG: hypothetical protein EAY72_03620 [Bacteroidota bacterium]TAF92009.1 MAG: hypothetical protein EAZ47_09320 [Bacteroidota bacterium]